MRCRPRISRINQLGAYIKVPGEALRGKGLVAVRASSHSCKISMPHRKDEIIATDYGRLEEGSTVPYGRGISHYIEVAK